MIGEQFLSKFTHRWLIAVAVVACLACPAQAQFGFGAGIVRGGGAGSAFTPMSPVHGPRYWSADARLPLVRATRMIRPPVPAAPRHAPEVGRPT